MTIVLIVCLLLFLFLALVANARGTYRLGVALEEMRQKDRNESEYTSTNA